MNKLSIAALFAATLACASLAHAEAVVGQAAPAFSVKDATGKTVSLADYKGKYVVLEWVNNACPFVKKHYDSGNIPATQKHAAAKGAVWLSVSTTGKADPKLGTELAQWAQDKQAAPTAILLDNGTVGKAYGARTTPHIYIVDPQGKLVYAGAIDSKPSANPADIPSSTNYVKQALDEVSAGKAVSQAVTKPYGCSVKYGA